MPLKLREGGKQQPVAIKTWLGWGIYGGEGNAERNFTFHILEKDLHEIVKDYICEEDLAVPAITVEYYSCR